MVSGAGKSVCYFVDADGMLKQQAYNPIPVRAGSYYRPFQAVPIVGQQRAVVVPPTVAQVFCELVKSTSGFKKCCIKPLGYVISWSKLLRGPLSPSISALGGLNSTIKNGLEVPEIITTLQKVLILVNEGDFGQAGFKFCGMVHAIHDVAEELTKKHVVIVTKDIMLRFAAVNYSWLVVTQAHSVYKDLKNLHANYDTMSSEQVCLTGMKVTQSVCFVIMGGIGLTCLAYGAMTPELVMLSLSTIGHIASVGSIFYEKIVVNPAAEQRRLVAMQQGNQGRREGEPPAA